MFLYFILVLFSIWLESVSDERKNSHNVVLSEKEFLLIQSLKDKPEMLEQLTTVTEKFNEEVNNGMDAYEAECHVIKSIEEIGRSMIANWAQQTQATVVEEAIKSSDVVKHGKKNSTGIAPSEKLASKPK